MKVYELTGPRGVTTTGAQSAVDMTNPEGRDEFLLTIELTSTGTVSIEGRIDQGGSWIVIAGPYTADTIVPIAFVPSIRANIAANGSGMLIKAAV